MPRELRLASNQDLFREVNNSILELSKDWFEEGRFHTVCECRTTGCTQMVSITFDAYRRIREDGRLYLVAPGHEQGEPIVEDRSPDYVVIEADD